MIVIRFVASSLSHYWSRCVSAVAVWSVVVVGTFLITRGLPVFPFRKLGKNNVNLAYYELRFSLTRRRLLDNYESPIQMNQCQPKKRLVNSLVYEKYLQTAKTSYQGFVSFLPFLSSWRADQNRVPPVLRNYLDHSFESDECDSSDREVEIGLETNSDEEL